MSLPTKTDLIKMDYAANGQPFVDIPAKSSIDLSTMDYSYKGEPFVRNGSADGGPATKVYSKEIKVSLPTDDANLSPFYNTGEEADVEADDDVYVDLEVTTTGYAIHLFKLLNTNNTDKIYITFKGRSTVAPSSSSVLLQIYNRNSSAWETIATNSVASANSKFTITGNQSTDLSNYYDGSYIISTRVYQQIT